MPMSFPDMDSLKNAAEVWKFRDVEPNETEEEYRTALARYVFPKDKVEALEIRYVDWDTFMRRVGQSGGL